MSWVADRKAVIQKKKSVVAKNADVGRKKAMQASDTAMRSCIAMTH